MRAKYREYGSNWQQNVHVQIFSTEEHPGPLSSLKLLQIFCIQSCKLGKPNETGLQQFCLRSSSPRCLALVTSPAVTLTPGHPLNLSFEDFSFLYLATSVGHECARGRQREEERGIHWLIIVPLALLNDIKKKPSPPY